VRSLIVFKINGLKLHLLLSQGAVLEHAPSKINSFMLLEDKNSILKQIHFNC